MKRYTIIIALLLIASVGFSQNVFKNLVDARAGVKVTGIVRVGNDTITESKIAQYDATVTEINDTVTLQSAISLLPFIIPPKLTTTEINALSAITEGTFVYDTVLHVFKYYNGSVWKTITTN